MLMHKSFLDWLYFLQKQKCEQNKLLLTLANYEEDQVMTTSIVNLQLLWSTVALQLEQFLSETDSIGSLQLAFGNEFDQLRVVDLIQGLIDGTNRPDVEIRSADELNGALGAFASSTSTIYLTQEFITGSELEYYN